MSIGLSLNRIQKEIDPIISQILDKAVDNKEITYEDTLELLNCKGPEMSIIAAIANYLCKKKNKDVVTYVVNRNINFTNVCIKRCGFCAFSRDFREEEGYYLPIEEIVRRAKEAKKFGATEICIQAGLPPKMDGNLYIDICKAIKKELPEIHIHAFSPEEILYGSYCSGISIREYLKSLKDAGLGSVPGTAAEILVQDIRDMISPGRIKVDDWIKVIRTAHSIGIPSTSTIMYGHIESNRHIAKHLEIIKTIQRETAGFTEFVPLSFVHSEAPMYNKNLIEGIRSGPNGVDVIKMHAISRIVLNNCIDNIQVSWVKEGTRMSQILLETGANDFGGTLINESISTSAGSQHGQLLKPKKIREMVYELGKTPAQRTSDYKIIKKFTKENDDYEEILDKSDPKLFGSYHELIKLDKFRFQKDVLVK